MLHKVCGLSGAGLLALSPLLAAAPVTAHAAQNASGSGTTVYVESDDAALLYEGQRPPDAGETTNPFEENLATALREYSSRWGDLPRVSVAAGRALSEGNQGARISVLRTRLGLSAGNIFDNDMTRAVREFRAAHGLGNGEQVDQAMINALNRGPDHYIAILQRNLRHAADLPDYLGYKYVHVDLTAQRLSMIEGDRVADTMAVVAGKPVSRTPAMAGLLRHAVLSPYWNVPPSLVQDRYARRIINGGRSYLARTGFEALSSFEKDAAVIPASTVNWRAVERGEQNVRLRQKPGPGNGMGRVKFMFPNALGIYLHDTPSKHLFAKTERLFSAGCVRLERPMDFGAWLFGGDMPAASGTPEEKVALQFPVPIYITYFTAIPDRADGLLRIDFREDIYSLEGKRAALLAP